MIIYNAEQWPQVERFIGHLKGSPIPKGGMELVWRKPKRSNKQNAYLWSVVYKTLSEALSEQYSSHITSDHVHELCRKYFMPQIEVPGTEQTVPMSTTELTRGGNEDGFQDYILKIQEFAAKKGVYIPDPQEDV
jgi:hypothetical protein